jgi:hypothetical protein
MTEFPHVDSLYPEDKDEPVSHSTSENGAEDCANAVHQSNSFGSTLRPAASLRIVRAWGST